MLYTSPATGAHVTSMWYARTASRTSAHVRSESRFPVLTTGGMCPASIIAICFANVDSANTSPRRGPVCVNMRVVTVLTP